MKPYLFIGFLLFTASTLFAQMTPTYIVDIPMRDSKFLAADVYVPNACSSCPTILIQTPYDRTDFRNGLPLGYLQNLQSSPFVWVIVDWRGFYGSTAAAIQQPQRGEDGYDVIDWIVAQPWSNGKVGTWGPSALGGIQYLTAKENHPNHTCAVPLVAHPQTAYDSYFYGGVLEKSYLQTLDFLGYGLSTLVLANVYYNNTWAFVENNSWYPSSIHIPTLQIGGWYDHNIDKMTDWFAATRSSADIAVRDKQWLLVGPWVHGGTGAAYVGSAVQGELTYPDAAYKSDTMARAFFDFYLRNQSNNWESTSKITYYQLGENQWGYSNDASIEINQTDELFLNDGNLLSTTTGSGSTAFTSDPRNPSPTLGGPTLHPLLDQGPYNQISLESRQDVITFTTSDLLSDITVSGRVKLNLFVECNQPDADIALRLVDVYPDGRNMLITDGVRRMRFRNGYTQADVAFMTAGQVYPVELTLPFTNYTWKTGHELKVYISANNAIRWDVNLQNGSTMYASGDTNTASITIHHNTAYPSKVVLPGNNISISQEELEKESDISVFPNPANNTITIKTDSRCQIYDYRIYNSSGQLIFENSNNSNQSYIIDISHLTTGIYTIQLSSAQTIRTFKFCKQQ